MAEGRIKRRIVWEKSGVSEIIGTILMLSITVVLFSSIITFVGNMPAPKQSISIELKCSLEPVNTTTNNWSQGVRLTILHQGGQVMDNMWTVIYIAVDDTMLVKRVNHGLVDTNGDGLWNVGEHWEYEFFQTNWVKPEESVPTLGNDSTISVNIIDQEKNALVWYEVLTLAQNVYRPIIKRAWIDSDIATIVDDPGPISFTAPFKLYVEVTDTKNDLKNVTADLTTIYRDAPPSVPRVIELEDVFVDGNGVSHGHLNDNIYVAICPAPPRISVGYYSFWFTAVSNQVDQNNVSLSSQAAFVFPVGIIVGDNPQIVVRSDYIRFSDPEPSNGDTVTITATIQNLGGAGSRVNVSFYDNEMTTSAMIANLTISVPQVGERDAWVEWKATPGGRHTIIVSAWPIDADELPGTTDDNVNQTDIVVMPKILLVDDDGYLNDLTNKDTVSPMRASLEAADFSYDFVTVGGGDGPGYDYGDYQLKNYDIVIWMTGYKDTGTITLKDTQELKKFLDGADTGGQGGSLWLISQGFWTEARTSPLIGAELRQFAINYLKVPDPNSMVPGASLPTILYGNQTHPVTDYFADNPINTAVTVAGTDSALYWPNNLIPNNKTVALADEELVTPLSRVYAITYDSDQDNSTTVTDSRRLSQTWDFSRMDDTAAQAQYVYKAIMWLGNITVKFTEDLAISGQTITPETVFFKQPVTISFTVRNNGLVEYPLNTVQYLMRILDMSGNDVIIPEDKLIPYHLGTGSNNTVLINYTWTPEKLGYHRIWIMVDPYYQITESNKLNNMISNYWGRSELNVQYRILLVDDDGSQNNGGPVLNHNDTYEMASALDRLAYPYELYVVNYTEDGPAYSAGTNGLGLSEYNAVIWVGGDDTTPLTANDMGNITNYTRIGGNFWFLGTGMWIAGDLVSQFQRDTLKIFSVDPDQGMGGLTGVRNDPISHGMDYPASPAPGADVLEPEANAHGFTVRDDGQYNSIRYHGYSGLDINYRAVTTAWPISSISDEEHRAEFVFMVLRWFDKPEERIELRITDMDIWISDQHPQLGSGYVIQASVHNTGGATGNVLVRFMDGNTQIGSDSISVSPGGKTTAEMIWVPLFAGQRELKILLDPIAEVPEIFEWSNNNATRSIYVYFFWDDMESGASKWTHGSTITLINGEGPLEYFGNTAVTVNIEKDWDYTQSENMVNCTDQGFYHTYDKSFWLQEPAGASVTEKRIPMDMAIIIDTTGSMSTGDRMADAIDAAKTMVNLFSENDRCALFRLSSNYAGNTPPYLVQHFAFMTPENKTTFTTAIDGFWAEGGTPLWDATGTAINYALNPAANGGTARLVGTPGADYVQSVMVMTDGDDQHYTNTFESGSQTYCPGSMSGGSSATSTWGVAGGNTWGQNYNYNNQGGTNRDVQRFRPSDSTTQWMDLKWHCNPQGWAGTESTDGTVSSTRHGMAGAPVLLYTVALEIVPQGSDSGVGGYMNPTDARYPFTSEYALWMIANTSGQMGIAGEYFYAPNSASLASIFTNIFESIVVQLEPEDQTRSSQPAPEAMATTTYNFVGVTQATNDHFAYFNDMDNSNQAELTNPNSRTELTNTQYQQIAQSDNVWAQSADPGNNDEMGVEYRYTISQNPTTITQIELTHEAAYTSAVTVTLFAWNTATSVWDIIGGTQNFAAWTEATITRTITVNPGNYVSAGGVVRCVFYPSARANVYVDYAQCVVTWTSPPYIVSTSPASGEGNVALNADIVITFSEAINPISFATTVTPDPGGWTTVWGAGNTQVTLSHSVDFTQSTLYTVEVISGQNMIGTPLTPYVLTISTGFESGTFEGWTTGGTGTWSFNVVTDRARGTYSAKGGQSGYTYLYRNNLDFSSSVNTEMSFYTQSINTEIDDILTVLVSTDNWMTYSTVFTLDGVSARENAASNWHFYSISLGMFDYEPNVAISIEIDCSLNDEYYWVDDILVSGGGSPNPWTFTTFGPPIITSTTPFNGAIDVALNQQVIIDFSTVMNTASFTYTCSPDPGGWSSVWSNGNTRITLTHTPFASLTTYTFTVTQAQDMGGFDIVAAAAPNPWSFTTILDTPPTIISTSPADVATMVPVAENIVITFSEEMVPATVTYSIVPNPGGLVAAWSPGNTVLTITHNNFAQGTLYTVEVTAGQDLGGNDLDDGPVPNPWSFRTFDNTPPTIFLTTPSDGSTGVGTGQPVVVEFSEAMDTASVESALSCSPNPGGWSYIWNYDKTEVTARHYDFDQMTSYTVTVSTAARDISGNSLASGSKPNPWTFKTGVGGGSGTPGLAPDGLNTNKSAVTKPMDLRNLDTAMLSFWHKYNIVPGANGGVLMLGFYNETAAAWQYRYVVPSSAYTGNLRLSATERVDSFNTFIQWGWNGISGRGAFTWEKVNLNILPYLSDIPPDWLDQVRVKFQYYQYGGGTGYGWYLDDVRVTVSRSNAAAPTPTDRDLWHRTTDQAHSGNYSWSNVDPVTGLVKPGIDNYLMTTPIDLTNAKIAELSAYVKFNFNTASGAPPDGFRVEISKDNGVTWEAVNLGVRSSWGVSGTGTDGDDGYPGDGKSYTGLTDSGNAAADGYWVSLGSLTRVNVDLSSFSGNAIYIRFRLVTNSDPAYAHSNNANQADPGFGGFYVDDVIVKGETIMG